MHFPPSPASGRPRLVGNAILLGQDTVLTRRMARYGCWYLENRPPQDQAALLSLAYGKAVQPDDPMLQAIAEAGRWLQRDIHRAAAPLAHLPEPQPG